MNMYEILCEAHSILLDLEIDFDHFITFEGCDGKNLGDYVKVREARESLSTLLTTIEEWKEVKS